MMAADSGVLEGAVVAPKLPAGELPPLQEGRATAQGNPSVKKMAMTVPHPV